MHRIWWTLNMILAAGLTPMKSSIKVSCCFLNFSSLKIILNNLYTLGEDSYMLQHDIDKYDTNEEDKNREIEDSSMFGLTPTPQPETKGLSRTAKAAVQPTQGIEPEKITGD